MLGVYRVLEAPFLGFQGLGFRVLGFEGFGFKGIGYQIVQLGKLLTLGARVYNVRALIVRIEFSGYILVYL